MVKLKPGKKKCRNRFFLLTYPINHLAVFTVLPSGFVTPTREIIVLILLLTAPGLYTYYIQFIEKISGGNPAHPYFPTVLIILRVGASAEITEQTPKSLCLLPEETAIYKTAELSPHAQQLPPHLEVRTLLRSQRMGSTQPPFPIITTVIGVVCSIYTEQLFATVNWPEITKEPAPTPSCCPYTPTQFAVVRERITKDMMVMVMFLTGLTL